VVIMRRDLRQIGVNCYPEVAAIGLHIEATEMTEWCSDCKTIMLFLVTEIAE
jgi:hypothetical protein